MWNCKPSCTCSWLHPRHSCLLHSTPQLGYDNLLVLIVCTWLCRLHSSLQDKSAVVGPCRLASSLPVSAKRRWACGPFCLLLILPVLLCQSCCLNNGAVFLSANLGTNICLRSKQALPGSAINRIIKQTVMSRITANYDKICFGICLRGSGVLKSAQEFITAESEQAPE